MKYISNFKKIVLICIKKKWLTESNPFTFIRLTIRKKKRIPLTQDKLYRITAKQFSYERLTVVRDIFLFSCYTGLAYADVYKLKTSEIFTGMDGYKWIRCHRQKTAWEGRAC